MPLPNRGELDQPYVPTLLHTAASTETASFTANDQGHNGITYFYLSSDEHKQRGAWLWDDTTGERIAWFESGTYQTGGFPTGHTYHLELVSPDEAIWVMTVSS